MKRLTSVFFFCLLSVFFLISCSSKPEKLLTGRWQEVNGKEAIEFAKGGSFQGSLIWDLTNAPLDVEGTFVVKGDLLDLTVAKPEHLTPMTWKVRLSGPDDLTITYQQGGALKRDGGSASFRRVK